jgi:predicted esterase
MSEENVIYVGHVETAVHGRFLLRVASGSGPAPLLVGFHGYGEGASSMLEALMEIRGITAWNVAAIQALHPFYNRASGQVVASWMTKQDRELAIADNLTYVRRSLAAISERVEISGPRVYAGFSQGTAMTYRAAAAAGSDCHGIVALVGDVPAELAGADNWGRPPVLIGRGAKDRLYDKAKWEHDERLLETLGSRVETCVFRGGHEWTSEFRRRAAEFLADLHG